MKTSFSLINPFTGKLPEKAPEKPRKATEFLDVEALTISADPLPSRRSVGKMKYMDLFAKLKVGQCIVCESNDAPKLGHALNTWLARTDSRNVVKTCKHYEADGKGRVWLLAPLERKPA